MKIGLIDVDGHNFPNLALMKLSAWHKAHGDEVEWWWGWSQYDRVYMSKVFDHTYTPDIPEPLNASEIIKGGTGYGLDNRLPEEVEHMMPDYSIYPETTKNTAYGFLTRGCPRGCHFCIVAEKEGRCSKKVSDLSEWWSGQKKIVLMDPNILACKDRMELLFQLIESRAWVDINQGLDCRLLNEDNIAAINRLKLKEVHFAWDYYHRRIQKPGRDPKERLPVTEPGKSWWTMTRQGSLLASRSALRRKRGRACSACRQT